MTGSHESLRRGPLVIRRESPGGVFEAEAIWATSMLLFPPGVEASAGHVCAG